VGIPAHPVALTAAIQRGSGQSAKFEAILWSCWNGKLCDALARLEPNLAKAVVTLIAARAPASPTIPTPYSEKPSENPAANRQPRHEFSIRTTVPQQ
jgi:hypothetical protein